MTLKVNGKVFTAAEAALTVAEVLQRSSVANPEMVAVQLNGEFVAKEKLAQTPVAQDDEVDSIYFMGGGAKRDI